MPQFVIIKDGLVKAAGNQPFPPADAVIVSGPIAQETLTQMMLVMRPVPPDWVISGNTFTMSPCPIGTIIKVADQEGQEWFDDIVATTEGETMSFDLTDPGTYSIELHFPLPYMVRIQEVTIT